MKDAVRKVIEQALFERTQSAQGNRADQQQWQAKADFHRDKAVAQEAEARAMKQFLEENP